MTLKMAERKAVTTATRSRYQRASKKDKGKILDEFIELTGCHRVYAFDVTHGSAKDCAGPAKTCVRAGNRKKEKGV